jgi:hypothetical protein
MGGRVKRMWLRDGIRVSAAQSRGDGDGRRRTGNCLEKDGLEARPRTKQAMKATKK